MTNPTTNIRKAIRDRLSWLRVRGQEATIDDLAIEMLKRNGPIEGSETERYQDYSYRELKLLAEVVLLSEDAA
ncbi:hypothetical protein V6767_20250 [Martelella sp. FLE1502]